MALSFQFFFGRLLNKSERVTNAKINAIVKGISASLSGSVGNADLAAASVDPTKVQQGAYWYAPATWSGGSGVYTGTWTPAVAGYVDGLVLTFKANAANDSGGGTGPASLDAGPGAKPIRKWNGKALEPGDIEAGQMVSVRYNSTLVGGGCWEVVGVPGQPLRDNYRFAGATATGTSPTAYSFNLTDIPKTFAGSYLAGLMVSFVATGGNTGGATLNVNAIGAKPIMRKDGAALVTGEIVTGQMCVCVYDGTNWQIVSEVVRVYNPAEGVVANGRNIVVKNNGGAPNSKADITADELVLKDAGTGRTFLASTVSVTADIGLGVAVNGLDAGVEAGSTFYYLWVIYNGTTVSSLISLSATAPTLPGTYTYKGLVGVVRNDAGSNFLKFVQIDRELWIAEQVVFTAQAGNVSYTSVDLSAFVPAIARAVSGCMGVSANTTKGMAIAGDANGVGAQVQATGPLGTAVNSFFCGVGYRVGIITAQTAYWIAMDTAASYRLTVSGYRI